MGSQDVQDLLFEGESITREVEVGSNRMVVTDRRLLVFTPGGGGKNYRHVERPNVNDVVLQTNSDRSHAIKGVLALIVGGLIGSVTLFLDTDGFLQVPTGAGGRAVGTVGAGGIVGTVRTLVGLIDDAFLWLGVIVGVVGLVYLGLYLRSREQVIAVHVAGERDMEVPTSEVPTPGDVVGRLQMALDLSPGGQVAGGSEGWSHHEDGDEWSDDGDSGWDEQSDESGWSHHDE